jgi:hypothetical protein
MLRQNRLDGGSEDPLPMFGHVTAVLNGVNDTLGKYRRQRSN